MTFEVTAGGIYKLPFPFTDLSASKARPALAWAIQTRTAMCALPSSLRRNPARTSAVCR